MKVTRFAQSLVTILLLPVAVSAQYPARDGTVANRGPYLLAAADFGIDAASVTFSKDIAPILQQSCQHCHRPGGGAPMSLLTYQDARRWARAIKERTAIRDRMGAMPPNFVEPGVGIQEFKNDYPLSDHQLALIQAWVDNGVAEGDPADLPAPLEWPSDRGWTLGEPDLIVRGPDITMPAVGPDRWGDIGLVPTGLTEDRYVASVEVREVNDIPTDVEVTTVGGRYIFHHMTYQSGVLNEDGTGLAQGTSQGWPIHEVGRNADEFGDGVGMLLQANSALSLSASHLHSTGWRETTGRLEFGFKFHPPGYEPKYRRAGGTGGNGIDVDVRPNQGGQEFHSYRVLQEHTKIVAFEPHLHAPGVRMCLEAIWGINRITLNCVGYDHNWVKQYLYEEHSAPLLPKGTIVHITGYLDTTAENPNLADTRNWAGGGRRSVANMFIDLGQSVRLTEEQFQAEMAERRARMADRNEYDIGCLLCWAPEISPTTQEQQGQDQDGPRDP
jgi:hypothetical protein